MPGRGRGTVGVDAGLAAIDRAGAAGAGRPGAAIRASCAACGGELVADVAPAAATPRERAAASADRRALIASASSVVAADGRDAPARAGSGCPAPAARRAGWGCSRSSTQNEYTQIAVPTGNFRR